MKITKIEIENLNSLKGKWCIDLTHPDYKKNHDLFVICGETGSGKTTILDAITLALYGRTPRQSSFGNQNELMTRHTARCMARVTYECKRGKFISEFSQNRAHGNVNGNLVAAHGTIINLDTDEKLPNLSLTALQNTTTDIIQLDYEQFCRSIMLAQGQFDDFISGDPKSKATILAKLNGTEEYKKFANALWIKAAGKIKEYSDAKDELDRIAVLTEEEVKAKKQSITDKDNESQNIKKQIDNVTECLNWLKELSVLEGKSQEAQDERKKYEQDFDDFSEKKEILENAEKSKNCNTLYVTYKHLREDQQFDEKSINKNEQALKDLDQQYDSTKSDLDALASEEKKLKNSEAELKKIWKDVRGFDIEIRNYNKSLNEIEDRIGTAAAALDKKKEEKDSYKTKIDRLSDELNQIDDYIQKNKNDEKLEALIPVLKVAGGNIQKLQSEIERKGTEKQNAESVRDNSKIEIDDADEKLKVLDEKLKNIVSTEYVTVSLLLRSGLEKGKSCPVCGSLDHPSCESNKSENSETTGVSEKAKTVAGDISDLNRQIDDLRNKKSIAETNKITAENDIDRLETELNDEIKKMSEEITGVNEKLSDWNISLSDGNSSKNNAAEKSSIVEQLNDILKDFENRAATYKKKVSEKQTKQSEKDSNESVYENIDTTALEESLKTENKKMTGIIDALKTVKDNRKKLFGDKDVDCEEEKFTNSLSKAQNAVTQKKDELTEISNSKSALQSSIRDCNTRIANRKENLASTKEKFEQALSKNGFENEEQFLKNLISDAEIEELRNIQEKLKTEDTRTQTNKVNAEKEYNECLKLNKTSKKREELENDKQEMADSDKTLQNEVGSIKKELEDNDKNKVEYEKKNAVLTEKAEEKCIWEKIQSLIGTKDGGEFEVFVESLAFKNLLIKANKYLFAISGKYHLVQKEGQVDFLVHDDNYPDPKDDRPVSNMSGGEKFIISLSLALGIAELASQNVRVDSLFLDEGFGTLSGKPLIEAINALKSLQSKGKMLGIITHIDGVIREFDQRITANKVAGGVSELTGSGITNF